jgi:hypothetical protein
MRKEILYQKMTLYLASSNNKRKSDKSKNQGKQVIKIFSISTGFYPVNSVKFSTLHSTYI